VTTGAGEGRQATLRPLTSDDAPDAIAIVEAAFAEADRRRGEQPEPMSDERRARSIRRMARFPQTDGAGCWGAELDGRLAGFSMAIRRQHLWGLAMLFVHPDHQSGRLGTRLLEHARRTAEGATVEVIQSSDDPRAIRRYGLLGLRLHPGVGAKGALDRSALPADLPVREGSAADLDLVDDVDRRLRGVPRTDDVAFLLDEDGTALVVADAAGRRGFAVHSTGAVTLLGADDEETATAPLWACLAHADGEVEQWGWTASQSWAVDVALAARLKIKPGGHMFLRGLPALPGPYLPSGVYF
jgi:GNAT superfamily N-acetyltransferase